MLTVLITTCLVFVSADVRLPPVITRQPLANHIFEISSKDHNMTCVAEGIPAVEYKWTKNGVDLEMNHPNIKVVSHGTFIFRELYAYDEGYYQCFAKNLYGLAMSQISSLKRAHIGRFPTYWAPATQTVKHGDKLVVRCNSPKSYPVPCYFWGIKADLTDMNPVTLRESNRVMWDLNGDLHFANVLPEDDQGGRIYICGVLNAEIRTTVWGSGTTIDVNLGSTPYTTPVLEYGPEQSEVVVKGDTMEFQCIFSGFDTPSVTFKRIGDSFPHDRYRLDKFGTVMTIFDVRESDEGDYTCEGANSHATEVYTFNVNVQERPDFGSDVTNRPHNINQTQGETAEFVCNAQAEPAVEMQWFKNGEPIDSSDPGPRMIVTDGGRKLSIKDVCKTCENRQTDLMVIQCNASNVHGYALAEGYLNVVLKTELVTKPTDINMGDWEEEVIFPCSATSDDATPVSITWYLGNFEINTNNEAYEILEEGLKVDTILLENQEKGKAEGKYTCTASNGLSKASASAYLTVPVDAALRLPPVITAQPLANHIFEVGSKDHNMTCVAEGIPAVEYKWTKNGVDLEMNHPNIKFVSHGTFIFKELYAFDEGYYQCFAKNLYGLAMSQISSLKHAHIGSFPNVSEPATQTVKHGDKLVVRCNSPKSYPVPYYFWGINADLTDRNSVTIRESDRVMWDLNGDLHFANVLPEDDQGGRIYICHVFNAEIRITKGGSQTTIDVNLGSTPYTTPVLEYGPEQSEVVVKGDTMEFQCIFSGFDTPSVTFKRIGDSFPDDRYTLDKFGTVMKIRDVRESDEGDYMCKGANSYATEVYTFNVNVQVRPDFGSDVTNRPHNINQTEGETAEFVCNAQAEPAADVQWFKNGEPIDYSDPGPRMSVTDGGRKLSIKDVCKTCGNRQTDLMVIQCNASNEHGYAFAEGYLNVVLKTEFVTKPTDINMGDWEEEVIFLCSATSDDATPVSITWYLGNFEIDTNNEAYEVLEEGLKVDAILLENQEKGKAEGKYTCTASNGLSKASASAHLTVPVNTTPVPKERDGIILIIAVVAVMIVVIAVIGGGISWFICKNTAAHAPPDNTPAEYEGLGPDATRDSQIESVVYRDLTRQSDGAGDAGEGLYELISQEEAPATGTTSTATITVTQIESDYLEPIKTDIEYVTVF